MIHREIALSFHTIGINLVLANGRKSKNILIIFQLPGRFSSARDETEEYDKQMYKYLPKSFPQSGSTAGFTRNGFFSFGSWLTSFLVYSISNFYNCEESAELLVNAQ